MKQMNDSAPTEAAAVSAVYAVFVEMVIYRDLNVKQFFVICINTAKNCASLFVLIGAGYVLSYTLTIAKIPVMIQERLGGISYVGVLLMINVLFLVAGMFVSPGSAIIVLTPMIFPLAQSVGIDPIHLGNIVTVNLAIGMYTPPFGLNIFTSVKVLKHSYAFVIWSSMPYILLSLLALALITFIPALSTWLPAVLT